jgi:predicted nucleic acid-binding protein
MQGQEECLAMPQTIKAVVIDANVLIAICAKEKGKNQTAQNAFNNYAKQGFDFFAPSVIVAEVMFILCQKQNDGSLSQIEYDESIETLKDLMTIISAVPNGEASLIDRANQIRNSYGCSRSSDSIYIALAEELSKTYASEILTFDKGFVNQVAKTTKNVKINLLPI